MTRFDVVGNKFSHFSIPRFIFFCFDNCLAYSGVWRQLCVVFGFGLGNLITFKAAMAWYPVFLPYHRTF